MIKKSTTLSALALMAGLTVVGASQAQPAPAAPNRPAAAQGAPPAQMAQMRAQMQQRMTQRRTEHAQDLATVLRLRPDQRPALDAFLASRTRAGEGAQNRLERNRGDRQERRNLTTPQRLDEQAKRVQERQAVVQQRTQALRTFYAALSPEQQQVFDALGRLGGGRGDGDRAGRGGMRMGGQGMGGPGMGMGRSMGPGMPGGFPPAPPPAR